MFGGTLSTLRKYDIKTISLGRVIEYTFECKRDRLTKKTGNVAVEHKALLHSEADFVVYMLDEVGDPDILYQIGRHKLTGLLKENWGVGANRPWRVVQGGEYSDWMTLIPVGEFIGLCSVM